MRKKIVVRRRFCQSSALAASCICPAVFGHAGPRIFLDIQNGQVVTYDGPYPPPETASGAVSTNPADYADYQITQVFPGLPPNETQQQGQPTAGVLPLSWDDDPLNFSTEFPGYQVFYPGSVTAGTTFSFNIMGEVQWYNASGGSFEPISRAFPTNTPLIAVNNDLGQYSFSSTGFVAGSLAFTYNGDPTDHEHLTYTICTPDDLADGFSPEDAPAGIYALPLQLTSNAATTPSKTYWLLFGDTGPNQNISQGAMETEMIQAIVSANGTLAGTSTNVVFFSASSSTSWGTGGNWQGGLSAGGVSEIAAFGDSIGTAAATVNVSAPVTVGGLSFYGSDGGSYTLTGATLNFNNGNSSPATISVNTGVQTINAPITLTGGLSISTATGKLVIGASITGNGSLTVPAGSTMNVASTGAIGVALDVGGTVRFANASSGSVPLVRSVPSLNISAGGVVQLAAGSTAARQLLEIGTGGLSIADAGLLDLSDNDMLISVGGASQLSVVNAMIQQGYGSGTWQGSNGIASSAAAADSNHLTALGVILNDNGTGLSRALYSTFDGVATREGDVLVKYTYYGDTDLNGSVDGTDYNRIDYAYLNNLSSANTPLTGWFNGDFNYDGVIDGSDYTLMDNAFNSQGASFASENAQLLAIPTDQIATSIGAAAVPEPGPIGCIAIFTATQLGRRRRRLDRFRGREVG